MTATIEQIVLRPVAQTQAQSSSTKRANDGAVKALAAGANSAFQVALDFLTPVSVPE